MIICMPALPCSRVSRYTNSLTGPVPTLVRAATMQAYVVYGLSEPTTILCDTVVFCSTFVVPTAVIVTT